MLRFWPNNSPTNNQEHIRKWNKTNQIYIWKWHTETCVCATEVNIRLFKVSWLVANLKGGLMRLPSLFVCWLPRFALLAACYASVASLAIVDGANDDDDDALQFVHVIYEWMWLRISLSLLLLFVNRITWLLAVCFNNMVWLPFGLLSLL